MDSSDLTTNLAPGILSPASAVRAAEGHPPNANVDAKARRRRPSEPDEPDDLSPSDAGAPPHLLDDLA